MCNRKRSGCRATSDEQRHEAGAGRGSGRKEPAGGRRSGGAAGGGRRETGRPRRRSSTASVARIGCGCCGAARTTHCKGIRRWRTWPWGQHEGRSGRRGRDGRREWRNGRRRGREVRRTGVARRPPATSVEATEGERSEAHDSPPHSGGAPPKIVMQGSAFVEEGIQQQLCMLAYSMDESEHGAATVLAGAGQPRRLLTSTFRNEGKIAYKGRTKYLWPGTTKKHRGVLVHKVGYVPSTLIPAKI
ncbi:uncharacterized protein [Triticum aestivum]|uniref:uncharacterized protein n=1 Tax=Triticum aestivum TaxID=4565 RepID=UPI001D029623|nr:uncharacterized protein LOC123125163 [Triticum aestivum]